MSSLLSPRRCFVAIALLAAAAMAFALYLDNVLGLVPCPLCMTQRLFVCACGLVALIAAIHGPAMLVRRVYAGLALLFAAVGGGVAARHVYLQHLPEELAPACGPGLEYMLENFPFTETLKLILMGDGNCAEVVWTFLGLSIPEQTLILFCVLSAACIWQLLRGELIQTDAGEQQRATS
ncbi:MAG: disulfide bond formation protein B [Pseudomonadota bacterium]